MTEGDSPLIEGFTTLSPSVLANLFQTDPAVGFALCDLIGTVLFVNERSAEIFTKGSAAEATGKMLTELLGEEWANERLKLFEQIRHSGRPIISRHILYGQQVQSTIRCLSEPCDENAIFSIMSMLGEKEPADPDEYDIVESDLVHLGPLDALTRREIEVLSLIGHGMTSKDIGKALHRSTRTIEQHCDSIRQKLKGASRIQLAQFAHAACLEISDADLTRL
jgi:DNA-binding CsgD family transcriptional regulator